jgi:hypothetical protein
MFDGTTGRRLSILPANILSVPVNIVIIILVIVAGPA